MKKNQNIILNYKILLLFIYPILLTNYLTAQSTTIDTRTSIFKEFQRDTILELSLSTDTKQLIKKKFKEEWQPVEVRFISKDQRPIKYKAKLRTRGNIRKKVCYYPPLKLKFKKEWLNEKGLDSTFNDLKLVVGCKKGAGYYKLVLKEYLTYQLYAALTKYSFKTQLVSLKLIDNSDEQETVESIGFIIENQDEMATRFNGRCTKPKIMRSKSVNADHWAFLSLFEFMIGNTDWAISNSHNIRHIITKTQDKVIPIAYDFDYSGIVDAPYATHRESLNIDEITTRYFLGSCKINNQLAQHIPLFLEKKATLYNIVNDFDLLSAKDRRNIIKYLDDFYTIISNPNQFKRSILNKCIQN